jgi:hypothetical protein
MAAMGSDDEKRTERVVKINARIPKINGGLKKLGRRDTIDHQDGWNPPTALAVKSYCNNRLMEMVASGITR